MPEQTKKFTSEVSDFELEGLTQEELNEVMEEVDEE